MKRITAEEVYTALQADKNIILLDVRTPQEYASSHIANSLNVPVDEVSAKVATVISEKEKTVYVYCLSGSRSDVAAEEMEQLGYINVSSMQSGLLAWRSKGFPLVTS